MGSWGATVTQTCRPYTLKPLISKHVVKTLSPKPAEAMVEGRWLNLVESSRSQPLASAAGRAQDLRSD